MDRLEVPKPLLAVARAQGGLVSFRQANEAGLTKRRLATLVRIGRVAHVTQGVYDCQVETPDIHPLNKARQRTAWLGVLATEPDGIATGACALVLHGVWGVPEDLSPEVALPDGRFGRGADGVRMRRFAKPMNVVECAGFQIADPVTALIQALPEWQRYTGIAVVDSALNSVLISQDDLKAVRLGVRGRRGAARLHQWWSQVDGRAESPIETLARLRCLDAGIPPTDLQVRITDRRGVVVAAGDLGWRRDDGSWVLAEMDGRDVHDTPEAVFSDRSRQNAIVTTGRHAVLRFTGRDLRGRIIPDAVRAALNNP